MLFIFVSCAGPSTPFGASVLIDNKFELKTRIDHGIEISSHPKRQYFNSPFNLKLKIKDPDFDKKTFSYEVLYNGKKLERWWRAEEIKFPTKKQDYIEVSFDHLSLLPGQNNEITFLYYNRNRSPVSYKFQTPSCDFPQDNNYKVEGFKISSKIKNHIDEGSRKYNQNPALVAALIAQESSFNPKAVSFARALGLTQITSTASREIHKTKLLGRTYPTFERMSLLEIKTALYRETINKKNDWRLDEGKSIEGGLVYLNYLKRYWSSPRSKKILKTVFDNNIPTNDIILASYNSGAARVKQNILKRKQDWLTGRKLKEARKYVMNINSYCWKFNNYIATRR